MRRHMILLIFALSIVLSLNAAAAQEVVRYFAFAVYADGLNSASTVRWLDLDSEAISAPPPLEGIMQCPEAWSPDGQWWVYQGFDGEEWFQYVLNMELGESRAFSSGRPAQFAAHWSPNSVLFAFNGESNDTMQVYDRRRGSVQLVNEVGGAYVHWLSNSEFIYLDFVQPVMTLYHVDVLAETVEAQRADFETHWFNFAIAPDFSAVIVNVDNDGLAQLLMYNWEREELTTMGDTMTFNLQPAWSPDSQRLAYFARGEDTAGIHILNLETGEIQALTETSPENVQDSLWSPAGTHLAVITRTADAAEYAVWNVETGESDELEIEGARGQYSVEMQWISDTQLLFTAPAAAEEESPNDLYRYDVDTEEITNLTHSPEHEELDCLWG